jgi:hypothetical protein
VVASILVDLRYQQPILRSRVQKAREPYQRDSNKREVVSQTPERSFEFLEQRVEDKDRISERREQHGAVSWPQ